MRSQDRELRVVIAEDDDDTRGMLRELILSLGVDVAEASSGGDLIRLLAEDRITVDLLITDVRMPWMTGLQVALSARNAGMGMPIIVVTAFPDDTLRAQIGKMQSAVLLAKPFRHEEMLSLVRERLPSLSAAI